MVCVSVYCVCGGKNKQNTSVFLLEYCSEVSKKSKVVIGAQEVAVSPVSLPGRVQLEKLMSSMATSPRWLKLRAASNKMENRCGTRATRTSPWRQWSPWSPDSHHSGVSLEPVLSTTCRPPMSVPGVDTHIWMSSVWTRCTETLSVVVRTFTHNYVASIHIKGCKSVILKR